MNTRPALPDVSAVRVLRRERSGSSSPVVVETASGMWFTKLRGAAQGVLPLIAELIVAELAEQIALAVPHRALVMFPDQLPSEDISDELRDLLNASAGMNVGFAVLESARNLTKPEYDRVPLDVAATVLWLDILVQNLDRSPANPNIMVRRGTHWLIDHGAALPFHHAWSAVREDTAQRPYNVASHVFGWAEVLLPDVHAAVAARITRASLENAVGIVPDTLLASVPETNSHGADRCRAMYSAYLWKRLQWMHAQYGAR